MSFPRIAAVAALVALGWSASAADLTLLGAHPTAALAGATELGTLKPYDGRIYIGHGEWNGYHQMVVACYNPATHAIEMEYLAPTDAIGIFREIDGRLYIPSTDPVHFDEFADYSVLDQGVWKSFAPAGLLHAFEMSTLTGSDLWMVGSKYENEISGANATVLRSFNGGRTWMDVTGPWSVNRQYWSLAYQGKLYVRDSVYTNNTAIQINPQLFEQMFNPTEYGSGSNQVILALAHLIAYPGNAAHNLYSFDGSGWLFLRPNIRDFAVRNSEVFTLEKTNLLAEAELWVGTSINTSNASWRRLPINNLTNGSSITVLDDIVYVGDTRGRLWAARIDGTPLQLGPAAVVNKMPDGFGRALAAHGPNLAVGAPEYSGTNVWSGQVTVWQHTGDQWTRAQTLDPPQQIFSGLFGKDVAMSETALAVLEGGRRGELARIHLYENTSPGWGLTQSLVHPYAHAIAMSGDRLGIATSTRVYIYRCGPGTNGFGATLETSFPHNATVLYEPTGRIAMHGDILAYGAVGDFSRQGGPGHVAIYERYLGTIWIAVTNLSQTAPPLSPGLVRHADAFGFALALNDGWLAVGAPRDDTAALQAGAVHLYQRSLNPDGVPFYSFRQKIPCPLHQAEARFGESLSISGDYLVVGASGIDDGPSRQRGSAFVYRRDGQQWTVLGQVPRLEGSIVGFGSEVLATTNLLFVGSRTAAPANDILQRIAVGGFPNGNNLVDLAVTNSITAAAATNGSALDYTFSVSNRGATAATDVRLAFAVPQNLVIETITSSAFACTNTGFDVICSLNQLAPNSTASIHVAGRAALTNTCDAIRVAAHAWSAEVDSDPSNNQTIAVVNPPGIRLLEPADGASFPFASVIQVNAIADNPTEFQGVSFYANATRLAGFTSPPYTYTWNLTNPGPFYLTLRTTNSCGLVATSAVANIVVRTNVPPAVRILHPISGTRLAEGSPFPIIVSATDEETPVTRALISANGTRLADLIQPPPYTYWWSNAPAGDYILSARVASRGGLTDAFARVIIGPEETGSTNWVVYIDHNAGAQTAVGVNGWNIPAPSGTGGGVLRNLFDNVATKASILISRSPGQARTNAAAEPNPDTPARNIFSGLVDFTAGPIPNVSLPGKEWVRYTFTGLDPNLRYNFKGTAVGGNPDYTNRWTLVELIGARSFLNSHTPGCLTEGVGTLQSNQVAFNSGDNRAGEVVGWDHIRPAPDGSIMFQCRQYSGIVPGGTSSGTNAFALAAMRLEELVVPIDPPPIVETNPIPTAVSIGGSAQFTVTVTTQGPVTYQWLRNGIILPDQTNAVLHLTGISTNDAGSYILIATGDTGSTASNPAGLTVVKIAVDQTEPEHHARLDIHGPPLQTYNIQKKDILSETFPWTDLSTITLQTNANTFIDPTSQSVPARFYRVIPLP